MDGFRNIVVVGLGSWSFNEFHQWIDGLEDEVF